MAQIRFDHRTPSPSLTCWEAFGDANARHLDKNATRSRYETSDHIEATPFTLEPVAATETVPVDSSKWRNARDAQERLEARGACYPDTNGLFMNLLRSQDGSWFYNRTLKKWVNVRVMANTEVTDAKRSV